MQEIVDAGLAAYDFAYSVPRNLIEVLHCDSISAPVPMARITGRGPTLKLFLRGSFSVNRGRISWYRDLPSSRPVTANFMAPFHDVIYLLFCTQS